MFKLCFFHIQHVKIIFKKSYSFFLFVFLYFDHAYDRLVYVSEFNFCCFCATELFVFHFCFSCTIFRITFPYFCDLSVKLWCIHTLFSSTEQIKTHQSSKLMQTLMHSSEHTTRKCTIINTNTNRNHHPPKTPKDAESVSQYSSKHWLKIQETARITRTWFTDFIPSISPLTQLILVGFSGTSNNRGFSYRERSWSLKYASSALRDDTLSRQNETKQKQTKSVMALGTTTIFTGYLCETWGSAMRSPSTGTASPAGEGWPKTSTVSVVVVSTCNGRFTHSPGLNQPELGRKRAHGEQNENELVLATSLAVLLWRLCHRASLPRLVRSAGHLPRIPSAPRSSGSPPGEMIFLSVGPDAHPAGQTARAFRIDHGDDVVQPSSACCGSAWLELRLYPFRLLTRRCIYSICSYVH